MLPAPLHRVDDESPFDPTPAAVLRISIRGSTVSSLCRQNISLDFFPCSREENPRTAISCMPPSGACANVERYESSFGIAVSIAGVPPGDDAAEAAIKLVRTVEVRRGIGSSGLVDCVRNGRSDLYGSGYSRIAFKNDGLPELGFSGTLQRRLNSRREFEIVRTID